MKKTLLLLNAVAAVSVMALVGCKKDKKTEDSSSTTNTSSDKKYALVIDNGAQAVDQGKTISYSAHLVSTDGSVISAGGVTWSSNIGGMSGANFSLNSDTTGLITASVDYEGQKYTASVPVCVNPLKETQVFAVVPSAIIWSTKSGPIQLTTVYFGSQSASYSFSSDNSGIASVSASGNITFNAAGNTRIKVTATIGGQANVVYVPVLVVGEPEVPLPVTRVVVTPALGEMFRGETLNLVAKAYNSAGTDVTSNVTFSYTVIPKEEDDDISAPSISVSSSGVVTAKTLGGAYVKVTASGVVGQAEIVVNPDTAIIVAPFYTTLGLDPMNPSTPKTSETFTATTWKVDRTAYHNHSANFMNQISNPSNLQWDLPLSGVPAIDDQFKVVTLSNKTNSTVTANTITGKSGATFVVAHSGDLGGAAGIMVIAAP
jgi:hypothetical protein